MSEITGALWLYSPTGVLLSPGDFAISWVEWALEDNTFFVLRAGGPVGGDNDLDPALLAVDSRFEIHRYLDGQPLGIEGDTQFLLRWWDYGDDETTGGQTWNIEAYSPEYALTGRFVDSFASDDTTTNPLTTKSGTGDDLMKAWVRENIGASTSLAARKVTELTVDADLAAAPSTTKSASYDLVFDLLTTLAEDSAARGTALTFGMVASGSGSGFTFKTWTGQRGVDHSQPGNGQVVVSAEFGNLANARVSHDHRQEVTAVRALGQGEGAARKSIRVEDTTRSSASPWAYREEALQTNVETDAALTTEANAALEHGRATRGFTGKFIDTDFARYGSRVRFGDLVTAVVMGESYACRLSRVAGRWDETGETLDIDLTGSDLL